jgi:hypothetical protein
MKEPGLSLQSLVPFILFFGSFAITQLPPLYFSLGFAISLTHHQKIKINISFPFGFGFHF